MEKRKKSSKQLLIRMLNPLETDIHKSLYEIEEKLRKIFKYHIGKENAISAYDLFFQVWGKRPDSLNVFEKAYLWNTIRNILNKLRSVSELFVVNNGYEYYVLKTMNEYEEYAAKVDRLITGLKESKGRALSWVKRRVYNTRRPYLID